MKPRETRISVRRRYVPLLRWACLPVLLVFSLTVLVGCYVPYHRLRDLEPAYHLVGDWGVKAEISPVLYSKNARVNVRSWHDSADTARIPLQDELLVADSFVVEYEAEDTVLQAGLDRCRFNYEYELPGAAHYDVDFFPEHGRHLLAAVYRRYPVWLDNDSLRPPPDAYLTEAPLFSCQPVQALMRGVTASPLAYWVHELEPDSLRIEPWNMPAPRSFGATWESEEIREPGKNGPIRITFRVRVYDLQSCEILHEREITEYQERHTEWDWYWGK